MRCVVAIRPLKWSMHMQAVKQWCALCRCHTAVEMHQKLSYLFLRIITTLKPIPQSIFTLLESVNAALNRNHCFYVRPRPNIDVTTPKRMTHVTGQSLVCGMSVNRHRRHLRAMVSLYTCSYTRHMNRTCVSACNVLEHTRRT